MPKNMALDAIECNGTNNKEIHKMFSTKSIADDTECFYHTPPPKSVSEGISSFNEPSDTTFFCSISGLVFVVDIHKIMWSRMVPTQRLTEDAQSETFH